MGSQTPVNGSGEQFERESSEDRNTPNEDRNRKRGKRGLLEREERSVATGPAEGGGMPRALQLPSIRERERERERETSNGLERNGTER